MAITTTPLGFQKPDGNERIKQGDDVISANAQKAQDLIAELQARTASNFDGGTPSAIYALDQLIDGGTV